MNGFTFLAIIGGVLLAGMLLVRLFDRQTTALLSTPTIRSARDQSRIEHEIVGALFHAAAHAKCSTLRVNIQVYASELGAGLVQGNQKRFADWRGAVLASAKALRGTHGHAAAQRACVLSKALEAYLSPSWRKPTC